MAGYNKSYYMALLENRAKRLNELFEVAAPEDMIYKEIMLLADAAKPFAPTEPKPFGYGNTPWGQGNGTWGQNNEEYQSNIPKSRCATG